MKDGRWEYFLNLLHRLSWFQSRLWIGICLASIYFLFSKLPILLIILRPTHSFYGHNCSHNCLFFKHHSNCITYCLAFHLILNSSESLSTCDAIACQEFSPPLITNNLNPIAFILVSKWTPKFHPEGLFPRYTLVANCLCDRQSSKMIPSDSCLWIIYIALRVGEICEYVAYMAKGYF